MEKEEDKTKSKNQEEEKLQTQKDYRKDMTGGEEKEVDSASQGNGFDEASYYEGEKFQIGGVDFSPESENREQI